MIDQLMRDLGIGAAVLGNLSAFYFYAYAGLQIPVGLAHDRWGPRRVLTAAAAFCALGSLCFALSESVPLLYLGRLMIGAGSAFGFVGALKLASVWFPPRRFAQLTGMTMMFGMMGGIAGQAPLAILVDSTGWRPALIGAAVVGAILSVGIWIVVRDRPSLGPRGSSSPAVPSTEPRVPVMAALREVLARPQNWAVAFIGAATTAPMLAFAGLWGVGWLMQVHGLSRPEAAGTTSLLMIGWAVGSPLTGALSDRLARRKPALFSAAGGGLLCLCAILYLPQLPGLIFSALFFLTGFFMGGMAVTFAMVREINRSAISGVAIAFINMAVTGTGAIFQPLIGALLDFYWDGAMIEGARLYSPEAYRWALSVLVIFLATGLGVAFLTRETYAKLSH